MTHPSQQFSKKGSHTKSLEYRPRKPKLTVEVLVDAVPRFGSITQRQLARRVNCSTDLVKKNVDKAIGLGLIEVFYECGTEKNFRRVKNAE